MLARPSSSPSASASPTTSRPRPSSSCARRPKVSSTSPPRRPGEKSPPHKRREPTDASAPRLASGARARSSSEGRPRTHCGSRSMCGTQILSQKATSPSFSFGSGPARLSLQSSRPSRKTALLASVHGTSATPGPIYNPALTSKWLGDAPTASFGRAQQRPAYIVPSGPHEVSSVSGKSFMPGPGAYTLHSSIGPQTLTRCTTPASYSFGAAGKHAPPEELSPGPVYEVSSMITKRGNMQRPSYSFGALLRRSTSSPACRESPGPGMYDTYSSFGQQGNSQRRSSQRIGFGGVTHGERGLHVMDQQSPGPIYASDEPACRRQVTSMKRSAPEFGFSRAARVMDRARRDASSTPGPGDYLI
ncbi:hypothetical protein AB1Y20_003020 [Prymnesium parvum]|uniref:Uncharacterized protein n=1 Tax=Prymnesium parvum TaxID=97485 RepID=A0AB34JAR1_PRYPA